MKKQYIAAAMLTAAYAANAQYYEIANQIPGLIQPVLSKSTSYKGFAEASYLRGIGNQKADFLEFTTTQGFNYSNWFFMGVGAGVDIMFSHYNDTGNGYFDRREDVGRSGTETSALVPLYTDFRFNIGGTGSPSFFADIRLGCALLVGKDHVRIDDGVIANREYFYLRPSVGLRVPVSKKYPRQAINVGLTYQLLTSDYWTAYSSTVALNSLGLNVSFEW